MAKMAAKKAWGTEAVGPRALVTLWTAVLATAVDATSLSSALPDATGACRGW